MRTFNTTGVCISELHYMVDISDKLKEIKTMVDAGYYFTINRARQYGKTTTIHALRKFLAKEYLVLSLDFQQMGNASFSTEQDFVQSLSRIILEAVTNDEDVLPKTVRNISMRMIIILGWILTSLQGCCGNTHQAILF